MEYNDAYDEGYELTEEELYNSCCSNNFGEDGCIENASKLPDHITNYESLLGLEGRSDYITEKGFLEDCRAELEERINNNEFYCKYRNEIKQIGEAYFKAIVESDIMIFNDTCNKFDDIFK